MTRDVDVSIKLALDLKDGPAWLWTIFGVNDEGMIGPTAHGTVPCPGHPDYAGRNPNLPTVLGIVLMAAKDLESARARMTDFPEAKCVRCGGHCPAYRGPVFLGSAIRICPECERVGA